MSLINQPYASLVLVQQILTQYGYPIIVIVGTLGNLLNILIFIRKKLRNNSCNNYFLASAFANLVILNIGIVPAVYTYYRSGEITTIYCKIRSYMFNAFQQMSRYLIVAACFDRFALCSTNIRLRQFCHVNIARRYIIPSIIIIWFIMPIYMLIFNTATNNSCIYPGAAALYNSIYGISLVGFTPPILMFVFSLLTFCNLKSKERRQRIRLQTNMNTHVSINSQRKLKKKDQQALRMLMIQVIVYVCTTTISSANLLYSVLTTYIGITKSNERKSIETFITFITGMLNYSCPCLSFCLFLFVSRLYQEQIKLIIIWICRRCCFSSTNSNNNINASENTVMRRMAGRVEPIRQAITQPISVLGD